MFELIDIEDHIPLPAPTFPTQRIDFESSPGIPDPAAVAATRQRFRQALLSAISAKYLFRVVPDVGLAVSVASIIQVNEDTRILAGQAKVWVQCTFTLVVFNPKVGDRLRARIVQQSPTLGMRLSVGFFDQIVVPPSLLVEGSEWSSVAQGWGIRDAEGAFIRYRQPDNFAAHTTIDTAAVKEAAADENNDNDANAQGGEKAQQQRPESRVDPASVMCCVEKVMLVGEVSNSRLSVDGDDQHAVPSTAAVATGADVGTPALRVIASFTSCAGLGSEWWFEENS